MLFLFRSPILRGVGNWLVAEDELTKTDAVFVLGGNSYERGLAAALVYQRFEGTPLVSTGANIPMQLLAFDTTMTEAELTKSLLIKKGVPEQNTIALKEGTSTREESIAIRKYCEMNHFDTITVISSTFHLRRVKWVFDDYFLEKGIEVKYHGASSKDFSPDNWWTTEEGLITVNNEMMKLCYYVFKY